VVVWSLVGGAGLVVLPWYASSDGAGPGKLQLLVPGLTLLAALALRNLPSRLGRGTLGFRLIVLGAGGFIYIVAQAFGVGGQPGLGPGAAVVATSLLMLFATGLAARGFFKGDIFVAGAVVAVVALVGLFTFYPVARILLSAVQASDGALSARALADRLFAAKIWRLDCLTAGRGCGVGWNTLLLAVLTATTTTALGLAFALVVTRTGFRAKRLLRVLTVLPIITPPFVIGLGLILLFGRSGLVNQLLEWAFAVPPTRWIYGLPGVWLAQDVRVHAGRLPRPDRRRRGREPSLEEASQTLRADRWRTFSRVSLPLMRPGLANAFLVGFIESIADFGNPIVLAASFGVLSTEVFFSIVGAQLDRDGRRRSACSCWRWRSVPSSSSGASSARRSTQRSRARATAGGRRRCRSSSGDWRSRIAAVGDAHLDDLRDGARRRLRRDVGARLHADPPPLRQGVLDRVGAGGVIWAGSAWRSFWTTRRARVDRGAADGRARDPDRLSPGAAALRRPRRVRVRDDAELRDPGTVIGVSYILAFNVPPVELTGTAMILVVCFVFSNMPVGLRAGMAAMSQIDASLDEASRTLGGRAS
jgi:iron(III) transport system permease protein